MRSIALTSPVFFCGRKLSARRFQGMIMGRRRKPFVRLPELQEFKFIRLPDPLPERLHGHAFDHCGNRRQATGL